MLTGSVGLAFLDLFYASPAIELPSLPSRSDQSCNLQSLLPASKLSSRRLQSLTVGIRPDCASSLVSHFIRWGRRQRQSHPQMVLRKPLMIATMVEHVKSWEPATLPQSSTLPWLTCTGITAQSVNGIEKRIVACSFEGSQKGHHESHNV